MSVLIYFYYLLMAILGDSPACIESPAARVVANEKVGNDTMLRGYSIG